jgi:hypothetical protein
VIEDPNGISKPVSGLGTVTSQPVDVSRGAAAQIADKIPGTVAYTVYKLWTGILWPFLGDWLTSRPSSDAGTVESIPTVSDIPSFISHERYS